MRTQICVAMLFVLLPVSAPAGEVPPPGYPEGKPLPVEATSGITLSARLELEMRRAGGPRQEVVEGILRDLGRIEDPSAWCTQVVETCISGGVGWAVFLPMVETLAQKVPEAEREYVMGKANLMKREAYLQALPTNQRQALYHQAIVTGHYVIGLRPLLGDSECALRALHEGMDELIPDIERGLGGQLHSNRESIEPALRLRKALIASDPAEALLKLIRDGVEVDVEHTLLPADKKSKDYTPFEREIGFAGQALREFRRLNPPGAAERLKEVYALYKPAEEKVEREREELRAKGKAGKLPLVFPPREIPRGKGLGGSLALSIVQAIGDLGDRDFERSVFKDRLDGLPTSWDRVHQVEEQLIKQGKMKATEIVATEVR